MSTHLPGFSHFLRIFASFCIGQISHQQHKEKDTVQESTGYVTFHWNPIYIEIELNSEYHRFFS